MPRSVSQNRIKVWAVFGDPVAGWASTVCIVLFTTGLNFLTIGILGQYIAKIYVEVKQRPIFIVAEEK